MKTITSDFNNAQALSDSRKIKRLYMKRRYWDSGSSSYIWESSWTEIDIDQLVNISPINWKLDVTRYNEFSVSNVVVNLVNTDNRWLKSNTSGMFGVDGSSANGYEPYLTKFQIRAGLIIADGTEELLNLFTGVGVSWIANPHKGIMQVNIEGLERLLLNANAENVSTAVTNESMGTGDGTTFDYFTANVGVGFIKDVKVDSVSQLLGLDYEISQISDPYLPAKITFEIPPPSGDSVQVTYTYWKKDSAIEDLVGDLCDEAGIGSGDRVISSVVFSNDVKIFKTWDTKADWDGGTKTRIDSDYYDGDIVIDELVSGNFENAPSDPSTLTWTHRVSGWTVGTTTINTSTVGAIVDTSNARIVGEHEFFFNVNGVLMWVFSADTYSSNEYYKGYALIFDETNGIMKLLRLNETNEEPTVLASVENNLITTGIRFINITRHQNGRITVALRGVSAANPISIDVTDNTYKSGDLYGFKLISGISASVWDTGAFTPTWPKVTMTGEWISETIDTGLSLLSYDILKTFETLNGHTITYYTRTSTNGSTWDSWTAIGAGGSIGSAVKRYIQVKAEMDSDSDDLDFARVHKIILGYSTSTVGITLANFTGMSCYDAIRDLGKFSNYEWGFSEEGKLFFRVKTVSATPDDTFNDSKNISQITLHVDGSDRIYSSVVASFGSFRVEKVSSSGSISSPLEIIGHRRISIDGGSLLIAKEINVADGIAQEYIDDLDTPKRRFKMKTAFWPQIDLADTLEVTHNANDPDDPIFLNALDCKVIGAKYDVEKWETEFDCLEI